jgi:23S rRNA pseudouridine2605 synthase
MKNVAERIDPETDSISYAGKELVVAKKITFALNKPRGYVSTLSDPRAGPTLAALIPPKYTYLGLKPVGRLDKDSDGLMLLTNDGALANRIMHPRYGMEKIYRVILDKPPPERILGVLSNGVHLPDGDTLRPMGVKITGRGPEPSREVELTLREGKKHEIRRAFIMFGYEVKTLRRIAIGPIRLGSIRKGQMVELSKSQMKRLAEAIKPKS